MTNEKSPYCNCLYYSSNALARIVTKMADEEFSVVNLSPSYAFVLMAVNSNPGIQAGELAQAMMLTPSTVTRLLEKLENTSMIKRHTEGRTTLVYPTKNSVALNDGIKAAWNKLYQRFVNILGEQAAKDLTDNIYKTAMKLEHK